MAKQTEKEELRVVFGTNSDLTTAITIADFKTSGDSDTDIAALTTLETKAKATVTGGGTLVQALNSAGDGVDITGIKEAYVTNQVRTWLVESPNKVSEVDSED